MKVCGYELSKTLLVVLIILLLFSFYNVTTLFNNYFFKKGNLKYTSDEYIAVMKKIQCFSVLSWLSYSIFLVILTYLNWTQTKKIYYKIVFTLIFISLIFFPIFPIITLINIYLGIVLNNKPFINDIDTEFPQHTIIKNNYLNIKNEFNSYKKKIECFRDNNPYLNKIDTLDVKNNYCWRTLYLKKTGKTVYDLKVHFPKTLELLKDEQIHNAFFSILDPKVEIKPHYGYYKGYLRYHLGINIPNENGKKPYIVCGGETYEWKNGEDVLFDDMYLHYVNNPTNETRVVLYLDIKRKNISKFTKMVTYCGDNLIENSIIKYVIKNQHVQDKL